MPFERGRLLRSATLRGALWITLIAFATTSVALTVQYVQTTRLFDARLRALVDDEAASLAARYRREGVAGVARAIERAREVPRINEFFYLLAGPDGRPLVGNLLKWPEEVDEPGYHSFLAQVVSSRAVPRERSVEARALLLPDGFRVLVGHLPDERMVLRERYRAALVWSLFVTGMLGLALGFWYSRRGLVFVDAAADAGDRFLQGHLEERLPTSGRGDEYDRLAATINRTFAEVERLIGSLRAATEGLAHDLKTPLTRIRARLELAELEQTDEVRMREVMEESRQDLAAILQLIEDVLGLARAEATAATNFAPLRLDAILTETLELYQPVADERGVELRSHVEPASITGARSLLAQMMANLIDNAIKYSPPGGSIEVELRALAGGLRFVVADSGPGIPESETQRAIHRFERLESSRSEPGNGLGLSIVAAAVRVHSATLEFSDNSPGLRVEITFPETRSPHGH